jgi:MFS family permease
VALNLCGNYRLLGLLRRPLGAVAVAKEIQSKRRDDHSPRRFSMYYGWKIVGILALTETISWGILYYAFSVFIQPMQQEFGWSRAAVTGAYSLSLLIGGLAGIPIGRMVDLRGPRLVMSLGSILGVLLLLAWSQVHGLFAFYMIWIGMGIAMAAVLYEPAFAVIATWFQRKRGKALTVLTLVAGFASVIFIPLAQQLVQAYDWRTALVILAALLGAATILPHILVLRRRPSDLGLSVDGENAVEYVGPKLAIPELSVSEAIKDRTFWWMAGAFSLNAFVVVALTLHLIPLLIQRSHSPTFAANAAGLVGLMVFPGRIIFNLMGERVSRSLVTTVIFILLSISLLFVQFSNTTIAIMIFIVLFGASKGAITPVRAAVVADQYGAQNYGSINGLLLFPSTIARALAPVAVGWMYDQTANYDLSLWTMVGLSAAAIVMLLIAQRQPSLKHSLSPVPGSGD